MSTENQYNVIKLKAVVSAMKDLEHARKRKNMNLIINFSFFERKI